MKEILELLELCFAINQFEQREKEKTGDKPTVFVRFSGHTASLDVDVYEKGWQEESEADKCFYIMLDSSYQYINDPMEELDNCIQYLKSLEKRCNNEYL